MKNKVFDIIYEDNDIIVVNKQAGVYTIEPRYKSVDPVLFTELSKDRPELLILHRLDKDTSGLVMFALNPKAHKILSAKFEENKIEKTYYAFVEGILDFEGAYLIDVPILISPGKYQVQINDKGKPSQTKIRIVEHYKKHTLIEAKLITGRTHQIRVHLQYLGYPLMIDRIYGNNNDFYLSEIKRKFKKRNSEQERPLISRQTLHAKFMSFDHPITGEKLNFDAELPKDLRALRNQLSKNS